MAHAKQDRFSNAVLKIARKSMVTNEQDIMSTDFEGTPTAGAVKIPVRNTEVSVRDYDTATGLAPELGTTTYMTITIGNSKGINEIIDGYDAAAVPDNMKAQRLESAAYSTGLALDTDALTTMESEGTTSTVTTASTATTALGYFVDENETLDLADIPRDMRYAILSPTYYKLVKKNVVTDIAGGNVADDVVLNGRLGVLDGVAVYMSNNMAADTEFIVGHKGWTQRINEWSVPIAINNLTNDYIGSSAVQGRMVYEHAITKATAVRIKTKA